MPVFLSSASSIWSSKHARVSTARHTNVSSPGEALTDPEDSTSSKREEPVLLVVGSRPDQQNYPQQVEQARTILNKTFKHFRMAGTASEGTDLVAVWGKFSELLEASSGDLTLIVSADGYLVNNSSCLVDKNRCLTVFPREEDRDLMPMYRLVHSLSLRLETKNERSGSERRVVFVFVPSVGNCDDEAGEELSPGTTILSFIGRSAAPVFNLGSFATHVAENDLTPEGVSEACKAELSECPGTFKSDIVRQSPKKWDVKMETMRDWTRDPPQTAGRQTQRPDS